MAEVDLSKLLATAETIRLDPEYFQKEHLRDEDIIENNPSRFEKFTDLNIKVDASAFYPSIEPLYGQGTLPFLRVSDVDIVIDFEDCIKIPEHLTELHPTLNTVRDGDIVLTKGGTIARSGLVTQNAAVSRDLIFINSSKLSRESRESLSVFFQTDLFRRLLVRSSSQTAQPHLTTTLVKNLPLLKMSIKFQTAISTALQQANELRKEAISTLSYAEALLISELGLDKWQPMESLSYERSAKEIIGAGRFDAEYFKEKYIDLERYLNKAGKTNRLGSFLSTVERGKQPDYVESGVVVINSKHVNGGRIAVSDENRFGEQNTSLYLEYGDVAMNGTGVGTIGRSAPYLFDFNALPDNHVTVLRPIVDSIDPIYLSVFINSRLGQMQVEQRLKGSSGQIELYPSDIVDFLIWDAPADIQIQIRGLVLKSLASKDKSAQILYDAKRTVEIAIENSEAIALAYLSNMGGLSAK